MATRFGTTTREASIESRCRETCNALRIIFRKLNFGEGWPDRLLLYKGHVLFIEFKAPGEKPTKLQEWMHGKLREQGFRVEVVDDTTIGRKLIQDWYDNCNQNLAGIR
jgi:hypothetical protein